MADEIWLDVLPAFAKLGPALTKGTAKPAKDAGAAAGKGYAKAFEDSAEGAPSAATRELEVAEKKASALVSKLSGDVSKARQAQQVATAKSLEAEARYARAVEKSGAESAEAQAADLRLASARTSAENATKKFENAEEALRQASNAQKEVSEQLAKAQSEVSQEIGTQPKKWGKLGSALDNAWGKTKSFTKSTGGLLTNLAGMVGVAKIAGDTLSGAFEKNTVGAKLNATLGATPAQAKVYGESAGELYQSGFGESMEDVGNSIDAVVSSISGMRDASQDDIEEITGYALNLAKAFDVDVAESATTAGSLIKNGLASDAGQAMDMITGAMQQIPQSLRGEVLPVMDEYGKHFAALGIDGQTAMGMIVASSADGAIGMDKMGDALKEFTIRSTDMSKTTSGVYETLGLDMQEMTNSLLAGGPQAEKAMGQIIHGLQGIKDPGEQAAASLALFGTPLEDLGTDQIPNFLGMVDPMGDAFESMDGKAKSMGDALRDNAGVSLEEVKRSFQGMLTEGIEPALAPLQSVFEWATNTPGVLEAVALALGVVAGAWLGVTIAASPWLAIALGIGAGIAGLILVVKNWGSIMGWLDKNILRPFLDWIAPAWDAAMAGMDWAWKNILKPVFDGVASAANWLWKNVLQPTFTWIGEAWENWTGHAKWAYDTILKPVVDAIGKTISWLWQNIVKPYFGLIGKEFELIWTVAKFAWNSIGKPIFDAVGTAGRWLWDSALKPAFGWVKSGWSSLVDGFGTIWRKYGKPVFDTISNLLKGDFPAAFESGKKAVKSIWEGIGNIVRKPVNFVVNTVYNGGLKKLFNGISSKLGLKWKLPDVDPLPAYAKGGLHEGGWALVGEEGPELVNFSSPGRVYTAKETQSMLAGREQAPEGALTALAGSSPSEAQLPAGGLWSNVWGAVTGAVGKAKDWVVGKIAAGVRALVKPIKSGISGMLPGAGINELIRGGANKLIDDMVGWAVKKDEKKAASQSAEFGGEVYDGPLGAFHRPSKGPFTSMYGPRWGGFHSGVDIAGGGPTYAALPGVVQRVGWNAVAGKTGIGIYLNHGPGLWTYYGHNPVGGPRVKVGDHVKAGQHIGYQGATGNVTGTHVHFEVHKGRVNGIVNPMQYLKYDTGGILEPGVTPVLNKTGKPEMIYTNAQSKALTTLAARGIESTMPSQVTLVLEDGKEFKAYVAEVADGRMAVAKRQARQVNRQMSGAR